LHRSQIVELEPDHRSHREDAIDTVTADLSSGTGPGRVFDRVDAWLGEIDVLVACAGVGSDC
jgi:short-subunit dehydrogenase